MSRKRSSTPSVALFPFLAVLVCTMGSLIFLLLITTRQIRERSVAAARAIQEADAVAMSLPTMSIPAPQLTQTIDIPDATGSPEQTVVIESAEPTASRSSPSQSELEEIEAARRQHYASLAERERELEALLNEWRSKAESLAAQRSDKQQSLDKRRTLHLTSSRRIADLEKELADEEKKLASLAPGLTIKTTDDASEKERRQVEIQIASLKQRLLKAQAAQSNSSGRYQVVPFDTLTGTSRRPILLECTDDGIRFVPENITIRPSDLEGFTPRVNPLLAGSNALVKYWSQWNLKQPQPSKEPEPYVLLLVRPNGTVAYYVALKMLAALSQPHGYELISEETVLQEPDVDPAAKAACEAAVNRLLDERNKVLSTMKNNGGSAGFASRGGLRGDAFRTSGGSSGNGKTTSNRFDVKDVTGDEDEDVGSNSWERIENFAGRNPRTKEQSATGNSADGRGQTLMAPLAAKGNGTVDGRHQEGILTPDIGTSTQGEGQNERVSTDGEDVSSLLSGESGSRAMGRRNTAFEQGKAAHLVPPTSESITSENPIKSPRDTGIEELASSDTSRAAAIGSPANSSSGSSGGQSGLDIGLGPSRPTPVPIFDQRSKKTQKIEPIQPEQFTRKRWGISSPDAVIGLERDVRVVVEPNRLVVADRHAIRMGEGESKQEAFERIVSVLETQAHDWGQPPQGFFWKPHLEFVVQDGANANYERAKSLAERAGLSTSTEKPHSTGTRSTSKPGPTPNKTTSNPNHVGFGPPLTPASPASFRSTQGGRP